MRVALFPASDGSLFEHRHGKGERYHRGRETLSQVKGIRVWLTYRDRGAGRNPWGAEKTEHVVCNNLEHNGLRLRGGRYPDSNPCCIWCCCQRGGSFQTVPRKKNCQRKR